MKKQILLPILAVALAVGSAYASHRLTPEFYPAGDNDCSEAPISQPCPVGTNALCTDNSNNVFYYIPDINADEPVCEQLRKPTAR